MNDRFKFRVWNKEEKKMCEAEGVYGYTDESTKGGEVFIKGYNKSFYFPEEVEIMQCTGLKDKNGKLIYEGDIIQGNTIPFTNEELGITELYSATYKGRVIFEDLRFLADVIDTTRHPLSLTRFETIEVIGNIYTDAHLLEECE